MATVSCPPRASRSSLPAADKPQTAYFVLVELPPKSTARILSTYFERAEARRHVHRINSLHTDVLAKVRAVRIPALAKGGVA